MAKRDDASRRRGPKPVGITNRPLEEEQRSQARVPPAGTAKGETDPVLPSRPGEHPPPRDPAPKQRRPKRPPPE